MSLNGEAPSLVMAAAAHPVMQPASKVKADSNFVFEGRIGAPTNLAFNYKLESALTWILRLTVLSRLSQEFAGQKTHIGHRSHSSFQQRKLITSGWLAGRKWGLLPGALPYSQGSSCSHISTICKCCCWPDSAGFLCCWPGSAGFLCLQSTWHTSAASTCW